MVDPRHSQQEEQRNKTPNCGDDHPSPSNPHLQDLLAMLSASTTAGGNGAGLSLAGDRLALHHRIVHVA